MDRIGDPNNINKCTSGSPSFKSVEMSRESTACKKIELLKSLFFRIE